MKGDSPKPQPRPLNLDERDVATNETDVVIPYFCGVARLAGSAIMTPIISKVVTVEQGGKK